jgi:prolyl oligopeptidase
MLNEAWQKAGSGLNKQVSIDDFAAAAEYLIAKGYTNKNALAIMGGYDGGLLVGAMIAQRPDLFRVAVGCMGIYDMMRFKLFSGGSYWSDEYGDVYDSVECLNMFNYSPLHHLKDNIDYPATVFVANENDNRSSPIHSYKFIAALQAKSKNFRPHLLFLEENEKDRIASDAFALSFIFRQFGLPMKTDFFLK